MQLVQIGEIQQQTIRDLITQMALRQNDEIERLRRLALSKEASRSRPRSARHCRKPGK